MNLIINIDDVQSVYSGKPGCCCGCRGKHSYAFEHRMAAGRERGYRVDRAEINDKTVRLVLSRLIRMATNPKNTVSTTRQYISVQSETRLYVVYFAKR